MRTPSSGRPVTVLRRLAVALVAVVVLLGLGLALAGDRLYPPLLEFLARNGAGLEVTVRGPLTVDFGPTLRIAGSDLDVAPMGSGDWQAELGEIGLDVDALALLTGRLQLNALTLANTRLRIQRSRQGGAGMPFGLLAGTHTRVRTLDITIEGETPTDRHVISVQDAEIRPAREGRPRAIVHGSVDGQTLSIDAQLATDAEAVDGGMSYPLHGSLEVAGWNLKATLDGHVAQPTEGEGLALQVEAEISDVAPLAALLGTPWPASGKLSLRASLAGDLPSPRLLTLTGTLEDDNDTQARIEGTGISPASREVEKLALHFEGPLPAGLLENDPALHLKTDASLTGGPGDYRITVDSLQASLANDAKLTAGGTLAFRDHADFSLEGAEFGKLDLRYEGALPAGLLNGDPGLQIVASGSLSGKAGAYRLAVDGLTASLTDGSQLTATGTLSSETLDNWASARSQLHLDAKVPDLATLAALTGYSLHAVELVSARADLTGTLSDALLENLRAEMSKSGRPLATIEGRLGPFRLVATDTAPHAAANTDVRLVLAPTDSRQLDGLLGVELKPPGIWAGQWQVTLRGNEWHLGSVSITAGREDATRIRISGDASGRGALDAGMQRILTGNADAHDAADLQVSVETHSARETAQLLEVSMPELGTMKLQSRLLVGNGHYALRDIELQSQGEIGLTARGSVGAVRTFDDVELDITLAPMASTLVSQVFDVAFPATAPLAFDLKLRRTAPQPVRISGDARVGSSQFKVDLTAEHTGQRPLVKGSIHSAAVATEHFWQPESVVETPAASETAAPASTSSGSGPLGILGLLPGLGFVLQEPQEPPPKAGPTPQASQQTPASAAEDEPLPWRTLLDADVDLAISVDEWRGRTLVAGPLDVKLVDTGGVIEFGPLNLHFKGGSLELHGVADANADPPSASFSGRGVDIPLAELVVENEALASEIAGDLSFDYKLKGEGLTVRALRSSLSGEIRAVLVNAQLPLSDLRLASGQLWQWLLTWADDDKRTPVPCAVAQFEIEGGIATAKTLYLQSSAAAVYGAGTIDLRSDTFDLRATPQARGLAFGRPTTLHIGGPLSAPTIDTESGASALLQYGGAAAGSLLFPPSVLLSSVLDLIGEDKESPCQ